MAQENGEKCLKSRKKDIVLYLSAQQCSGDLAMRLHCKGIIADGTYQEVNNFGPKITEAYKIGVILDAVIAVCALNPTRIMTFTQVLRDMNHEDIADLIDGKLQSCQSLHSMEKSKGTGYVDSKSLYYLCCIIVAQL